MEEARSSVVRRVTVDFVPQRTADAILALAFEWLIHNDQSARVNDDSVQNEAKRGTSRVSLIQEVMR